MKPVTFSVAILAALTLALTLSGCMVGPKYARPSAPVPQAYREPLPDSFKETKDWHVAHPEDRKLPAKWWEVFGDSQLNSLEEQVSVANQNLRAAEARFRQARAMIRYNRSAEFPTISTAPTVASVRDSANRPYFPSTLSGNTGDFVLPFDLNYELDLWGRVRRSVTAAREESQASAADLASATLSMQAELAYDYFELRSADTQNRLLEETVKAYTDAVQLTRNRYEGGAAPKSDLAQAETQLESTRVQYTDVGVQRAQFEHAIAVLIGRPPANFHLETAPLSLNLEPPAIPVGVPSQLLERRPDVASAERRMAETNEQIGIARAAFFPTVTLGLSAGVEGTSLLNVLNWPSRFWAVGPMLAQTLFDGGRRRAVSESAQAGYDAQVATYRQTVLDAFQQVEDNLAALRILESETKQQHEAVVSAEESLALFTNRYKGGVDDYLSVITAQTTALSNQRNEVDIQRRRIDATVLLIKALGGSWNVSQLPT